MKITELTGVKAMQTSRALHPAYVSGIKIKEAKRRIRLPGCIIIRKGDAGGSFTVRRFCYGVGWRELSDGFSLLEKLKYHQNGK